VTHLTYEIYLASPEIRDEIERGARQARAEAVEQYVTTPCISAFTKLFRRAASHYAQAAARRNSVGKILRGMITDAQVQRAGAMPPDN
jgi:hypothetical protein